MNSAIVNEFDRSKQHTPDSAMERYRNPSYRTRLKRQAQQLLNRQGDRPLRNQQTRLINRARRLGLLGVHDAAA